MQDENPENIRVVDSIEEVYAFCEAYVAKTVLGDDPSDLTQGVALRFGTTVLNADTHPYIDGGQMMKIIACAATMRAIAKHVDIHREEIDKLSQTIFDDLMEEASKDMISGPIPGTKHH